MLLRSDVLAALEAHYTLLLKWSRVVNLTRVIALEEAVLKHYAESLFLGSICPIRPTTLADLGSGAGFPGVPLAALWPECVVTLVESDTRKAAFLRECRDLLPNLRVACSRGERLAQPFDVVVARAVRPADVIRVARRCSDWVGLLVSEVNLPGLGLREPVVSAVPGGVGVAAWSRVSRET